MTINVEHITNAVLVTIAAGLIGFVGRKIYKLAVAFAGMIRTIASGIKALLYYRLRVLCERHIERGSITTEDLKDVNYMYRPYHALKGNGTIDRLVLEVRALPIVKEYNKERSKK